MLAFLAHLHGIEERELILHRQHPRLHPCAVGCVVSLTARTCAENVLVCVCVCVCVVGSTVRGGRGLVARTVAHYVREHAQFLRGRGERGARRRVAGEAEAEGKDVSEDRGGGREGAKRE